jgi:hypothetical protein
MYSVFTRLGDGEMIFVASRDGLDKAVQLAKDLNASWPHEYVVRNSEGSDVDLRDKSTIQSAPRAASRVTESCEQTG